MKIKFSPAFPTALRSEVEDLLEPLAPLVNLHVDEVRVALKGAEADIQGEACIIVKREYHAVLLWLDPVFFGLDEDEKASTILHEFFHVLVDLYSREVQRAVINFVPEGMQEYVWSVLEDAEEQLVNSLAISFERLLAYLTPAHAGGSVSGKAIKDFYEESLTA